MRTAAERIETRALAKPLNDNREYEKIPVGKPFPNERVILLDEDKKEIHERNKVGEICVVGTPLSLGYFNNKEQTDRAFEPNPNH